MKSIYKVTYKEVSFGRVELWKVYDFWQVRRKGMYCETTDGCQTFEDAVELYNKFN